MMLVLLGLMQGCVGLLVMNRAADLGNGFGMIVGALFVSTGLMVLAMGMFAVLYLKDRK